MSPIFPFHYGKPTWMRSIPTILRKNRGREQSNETSTSEAVLYTLMIDFPTLSLVSYTSIPYPFICLVPLSSRESPYRPLWESLDVKYALLTELKAKITGFLWDQGEKSRAGKVG